MDQETLRACVTNESMRDYILPILMRQDSPDMDVLEAYVEGINPRRCTKMEIAILTKYAAQIKSPNTMEATMTKAQLYKSGSTLWARTYSPQMILNILSAEQKLKKGGYQNYLDALFGAADADSKTYSVLGVERLVELTLEKCNK